MKTQETLQASTVIKTVFLVIAMLFTQHVMATPMYINYQGVLNDNNGVPVNTTVSIKFNLYPLSADAVPTWTETQNVVVTDGIFSTTLGSDGANPFATAFPSGPPANLFIGMEVGGDSEMIPRQEITSSFFAISALTVDDIAGKTPDEVATHIDDTVNPHSVTAAQSGAASSSALSSHTGDSANPHSVTTAQIGAADSTDLTSHTGNSGNPHSVTAAQVGAPTSANYALHIGNASAHHGRYANTEAVAAIKNADGAGSTLDADYLDGFHATDIIDAASDEVRTPISSAGYAISTSGSYYLTGNLTATGANAGIFILADNVTVDLMGFSINGPGSAGTGFGISMSGRSNIEIKNGTIRNFGKAGIYDATSTSHGHRIFDMRILDNGASAAGATSTDFAGITVYGNSMQITNNVIRNSGSYGIYAPYSNPKILNNSIELSGHTGIQAGAGSTVSGNNLINNGGYGISASTNSQMKNNSVYSSDLTGISGGSYSTIIGNSVYQSGGGSAGGTTYDGIYCGSGCTIISNTASNAADEGIYTGSYSVVKNNSSYNNGGDGIYASGGNIIDNTSYSNAQRGIYIGTGGSAKNNNVYGNEHWGISAGYGASIVGNNVYNNNTSNTAAEGGIYLSYDGEVRQNSLDGNLIYGIYVFGNDNVIDENTISDSVNGIYLRIAGNFVQDNRITGHGTGLGINNTTTEFLYGKATTEYLNNGNYGY